jgi:hypothetical protein
MLVVVRSIALAYNLGELHRFVAAGNPSHAQFPNARDCLGRVLYGTINRFEANAMFGDYLLILND